MMRQYELVERVTKYDPDADEDLLNRAYVYAMKAHGNQKRASGEAYFNHPLEVAAILTEMKLDSATIAAALLHDTVEDTEATEQEIEEKFGKEIASLVDGLTKIAKLDLVTKEAAQAENLRKLLLAMSRDVRVLLVKLADRLHNMRTLEHVKPDKRVRIAQETMDIYAPLAGRMGMQAVRDELEDIAFKVLNPDAYKIIIDRLAKLHADSGGILKSIEQELTQKLVENGIKAEVYGREKRPFSIFRKMERKLLSLGQLSDIFGFRVIVGTVDQCYRALGIIHRTYRAVPGRFKDYISTPKQNDYRSIHTTVIGPHHMRVEMQIRTRLMHEIAERGVAAHAIYKDAPDAKEALDGFKAPAAESNAYRWLRHLVEMLQEGESPREFLEHTKLELFHDQVFCFTPKGKLIALPKGATPIDFAYAVHTSVGDSCVGAKVNGSHAPLVTELQNGDEVEIIRSKAQVPPAAWESIVVTGKARASIRRAARAAIRKQYAGLGRKIVERAFERAGHEFSEEKMKAALHRLAQQNIEDMLASVGRGEIPSANVLKAVYPDHKEERAAVPKGGNGSGEAGWFGLKKGSGMIFRVPSGDAAESHAIPIRGLSGDMPVRFAPEGGAVPGDRIVGILTPGEGITIYPIQSPSLQDFEDRPEQWLDLRWDVDEHEPQRFPARIVVKSVNEPGSLVQLAQVIAENDGNIDNIHMERQSPDFTTLTIDLEVYDLKHLTAIIAQLRAKAVVASVARVNG